jgi:hypothetical protein
MAKQRGVMVVQRREVMQCRLWEGDEVAASSSGRFLAMNGAVLRRLPSSPPSLF